MIYCSSHPLVGHHVARLRAAETPPPEFRALVRILSLLIGTEATADLESRPGRVLTPLAEAPSHRISPRVGIAPIMRAGLGMVDPLLELIPQAEVWHLGMYRDEETLKPCEYYNRLPGPAPFDVALVADPMLATGGSAVRACEILSKAGVARIKLLALIAAPEGISRMQAAFPEIPIHAGAIDERLNERGFIVPGLGDAGDRQFATA
jgi:uracil phosphoribosyltransferase